jgi:hypothetical protein
LAPIRQSAPPAPVFQFIDINRIIHISIEFNMYPLFCQALWRLSQLFLFDQTSGKGLFEALTNRRGEFMDSITVFAMEVFKAACLP